MVRIEHEGPVTVVLLDRPDVRNAVDGPTASLLADAFRAFDADENASVAVLAGLGGTFCAGADLKALSHDPARTNRLAPDGDGPMGPTRLVLTKPVIAAISGHAVAGGLELACWCDLRIVEADAVLGVFCRRWGVPLIDGGTVRLPRLVGLSHALDLILTGRPIDADEAWRMGLANRVVPPGEALAAAIALGKQLAAFPQECLRADRASALAADAAGLDQEFARGIAVLEGAREGAARFVGRGREGASTD